jgi:hypothetical protein
MSSSDIAGLSEERMHGAVIALAITIVAPEWSHMNPRRLTRFAAVFLAAVAFFAIMAATASAHTGDTVTCSVCHTAPSSNPPTVTLVSDVGGTATYSVHQTQAAWAAFDGSTYITGGTASDATFSGPSGHPFTVFAVTGLPGPIGITRLNQATEYTITPSAGANGAISPATVQTVAVGGSKTFTITPDAGYQVDALTVDGSVVAPATSYTFSNVTDNHTIAVTFKVAAPTPCAATISLTGLKAGALKLGKKVTVKGTVKPAHAVNATVAIQRKVGAKWVKAKTVACTVNATSGAYSYVYKPLKKGAYRVKTSIAKTATYASATTAYKAFKVK